MDVLRSWLAAIVVYVGGSAGTAWVAGIGGDYNAYAQVWGAILWVYVPMFVLFALVAAAASGVHTRPARWRVGRHLFATLTLPCALIVISMVLGALGVTTPVGLVLSAIASIGGTAAGWLVTDAIWRAAATAEERTGYF